MGFTISKRSPKAERMRKKREALGSTKPFSIFDIYDLFVPICLALFTTTTHPCCDGYCIANNYEI